MPQHIRSDIIVIRVLLTTVGEPCVLFLMLNKCDITALRLTTTEADNKYFFIISSSSNSKSSARCVSNMYHEERKVLNDEKNNEFGSQSRSSFVFTTDI